MSFMTKKDIRDLSDDHYQGKRVLVRTDYNVPMDKGVITSDYRIRESLPTLKYLLEKQARLILVTHIGRPKGQIVPELSVRPVVNRLKELLPSVTIRTYEGTIDKQQLQAVVDQLQPGEVLVLENIRYEPGETKNDPTLSQCLASIADVFVNDAFGAAHRAHASTVGVTQHVPVKVAGLLMSRELQAMSVILQSPECPYTAVIGGSKVSTKIAVLEELIKRVTNVVIGGGMVFTFLKAQGYSVGNSLVEEEHIETAKQLMQLAEKTDTVIILPKDVVVADQFSADAENKVVPSHEIPDGWMGLDIGPESTERIKEVLRNSKTVFWNGPLGVFEFPAFATASRAVAELLAKDTREGFLTTVVGGGDTEAAIDAFDINPLDYTHLSTGGGATLELLEGKELPGLDVLEEKMPTASVTH